MRGSGPNRKHAFKDALTHTGCPDPRIDLVCITSSVLANSFNFKRHRRCLSHLLESLCLTQAVYSISMPRSGRRPQHQKRTSEHVGGMSALPPKADIGTRSRDVCFVPKAAVSSCSKNSLSKASLFDHLIGRCKQRRGMARLSAFALLRLITSSYLVGACTGAPAKTKRCDHNVQANTGIFIGDRHWPVAEG